ncbi:MAG: nicotinamide-nucleotide amidohydrolase family protein [Verrucomicrobia bacterium]|nr:nicotinamide-nucleotide amidohydrolase family protein [Verrucomicrobiota bacterium]
MRIVALMIGDELLTGEIADTNSHFLAEKLFSLGYRLSLKVTASDRDLFYQLERLKGEFDLLITSGGLGPTHDDVTKETIEKAFGVKDSEERALVNPVGSASGTLITKEGYKIVLLPGVPTEFQAMVEMHMRELLGKKESSCFARRVNYCLLSEEKLAPFLQEAEERFPGIEVGVYPKSSAVSVVLRGEAVDKEFFDKKTDPLVKELYERFPTLLFPSAKGDMAEAIHEELLRRGEKLALAESCTGGAFAERFTRRSGASGYFLGSIVSYADSAKEDFLGVSSKDLKEEGAVSQAVVEGMAEGLLKKTKADWVIAISGIAGPDGGSVEKPVGTIWAAIGKRDERLYSGLIPLRKNLPRKANIERSIEYLLAILWRKMAFSITPFT